MQRRATADALTRGFWSRLGTAIALLGAAFVAPVSASAATVTGSSGSVKASMEVETHNPKVDEHWVIHFYVTSGGKSTVASVSYEWLYGGMVVAHREHHRFTGTYSDTLEWPAQAVGEPLTFRAVIVSGKATIDLDYAVKVLR